MNAIVPFIKTHPFFENYPLWDLNFFKNELLKFGKVSVPPINILESIRHYTLEMAIPGFDKNDFKISIDEKAILCIEMNSKLNPQKAAVKKLEFDYSDFTKHFSVPSSIDKEHITASYTDGILRIYLPKMEKKTQAHVTVIPIN